MGTGPALVGMGMPSDVLLPAVDSRFSRVGAICWYRHKDAPLLVECLLPTAPLKSSLCPWEGRFTQKKSIVTTSPQNSPMGASEDQQRCLIDSRVGGGGGGITSGNWRVKHNSLSRGAGADQPSGVQGNVNELRCK
jgi:hypothetical protein